MKSIQDRFEQFSDVFLQSDAGKQPRDLNAMILMQKLAPTGKRIISASEPDEIFFATCADSLNKSASDADIEALVRMGVRYSPEYDCFCMFT